LIAWREESLGDLCDITIGRTPSRAEPRFWRNGTLPWLSIADMSQGVNLAQTKERITEVAVAECGGRLVNPGTLLMSFKLSVGKLGFARVPMYTNEAIAALPVRAGKRLEPRFLFRALQNTRLSEGADRAVMGLTLNGEKLARIRIAYPVDENEQRRIVDILDKGDTIRRKRREAIAITEELLRSTFLEMFGDPVTNRKGWPTTTVGRLCFEYGGALQTGPFGSQLHASDYSDRGTPVVMPQDLINGGIALNQIARVGDDHVSRLYRHRLELGDVVFSRRGDVARFAVIEDDAVGWLCGTGCLRVRFGGAPVIASYLRAEFSHPSKRQWLEQEAKGTTMLNLNTSILARLPLRLPPIDIQHRFAEIANRHVAALTKLRLAFNESTTLFETLVALTFSETPREPSSC